MFLLFFSSLCYDRPKLDKTCTICRSSSSVNEEVHEDLLQDVFTVWWHWWKRFSSSTHTDSHCLLLLQQSCQQRATFRVDNGLDNNIFFFSIALKRRFDSATQITSSQQVCCANRRDENWNREQSHHKHFWSSRCRLGGWPHASQHFCCGEFAEVREAGRVLGWGEYSPEVRGRKEAVTGLEGVRRKRRM